MNTKNIVYNIHHKLMYINWLAKYNGTPDLSRNTHEFKEAVQDFTKYVHQNLIVLPEAVRAGADCIASELDQTIVKAMNHPDEAVEEEILFTWKEAKKRIEIVINDLCDYFWVI